MQVKPSRLTLSNGGLFVSVPLLLFSFITSELSAAVVSVKSGNGSVGGRDSAITFLLGPTNSDFTSPLSTTNFLNAEVGPSAFILNRNQSWISGISVDPTAKWIGTNSGAATTTANTALYAVSFTVPKSFSSAALTLHYAVDDGLGGVFLNGIPVCTNSISNVSSNFTQEHIFTCSDVRSALHVGVNWLFLDAFNLAGVGGLIFSGTVNTVDLSPSISVGGIVNAASNVASPLAPGSIATVYGSFPISSASLAGSDTWPVILSGLSMQFGPWAAPLDYVSPGQVNLQVPWEAERQSQVLVAGQANGQLISGQNVQLAPYAPGIFTTSATQGAILNADFQLVDQQHPAIPGTSLLQIFCTGLGAVTNQPVTGAPALASPLSKTLTPPLVTIGGVPCPVLFSGLAPGFVGEYQVNVQIPPGVPTGSAVPVILTIGGVASNTVSVAIAGPTVSNPFPRVTSLSPTSIIAGSTVPLALLVNGSGFTASSIVSYNSTIHTTTYIDSGGLSILLGASELINAGDFPVTVSNPLPGGGTSSPVSFTVLPLTPTANLTGKWKGTWRSTLGINGSANATLTQNGTAITGTMSLSNSPCFASGSISGTISGNQLSLALTFVGGSRVTFTGGTNLTGSSVAGQYSVQSGSCAGDVGGISIIKI